MRRIASWAGLAVMAIVLAPVAPSTAALSPSAAVAQAPDREDSLAVIEGTVVADGSQRPLSRASMSTGHPSHPAGSRTSSTSAAPS